jgi:hypothetical protein
MNADYGNANNESFHKRFRSTNESQVPAFHRPHA